MPLLVVVLTVSLIFELLDCSCWIVLAGVVAAGRALLGEEGVGGILRGRGEGLLLR